MFQFKMANVDSDEWTDEEEKDILDDFLCHSPESCGVQTQAVFESLELLHYRNFDQLLENCQHIEENGKVVK